MGKLNQIDLFRRNLGLHYQLDDDYSTFRGRFLSVLIGILGLSASYFFGQQVVIRSYPTVIPMEYYSDLGEYRSLGTDIPIAFGFQRYEDYSNFYDPAILTLQGVYTHTYFENGELKVAFDSIDLQQCERSVHFNRPNLDQQVLELYPYDKMYCIPKSQEAKVGGNIDQTDAYQFAVIIKKCSPQYSQVKCKSDSEIQDTLQAMYFVIYYQSAVMNPSQNPPITLKGRTTYTLISIKFPRDIDLSLNMMRVQRDEGFLIEDFNDYSGVNVGSLREMTGQLPNNILINMIISMSLHETQYTVQFKKLQEVFADIGGFMSLAIEILSFIFMPLFFYEFFGSLINDIFILEEDNNKQQEYNKINAVNIEQNQVANFEDGGIDQIKDLFTDNHGGSTEMKKRANVDIMQKKLSKKLRHKNVVHINQCNEVSYLLGCEEKSRQQKIFNFAQNSIQQQTDIVTIVRKLNEIEQLQQVIMTPEQRKLFDFANQPIIKYQHETNRASFYQGEQQLEMDEVKTEDQISSISNTFDAFSIITKKIIQKQEQLQENRGFIDPFELYEIEQQERLLSILNPVVSQIFSSTFEKIQKVPAFNKRDFENFRSSNQLKSPIVVPNDTLIFESTQNKNNNSKQILIKNKKMEYETSD